MIDLSILIVGFNNNEMLEACIRNFYTGLMNIKAIQFEIIIVENSNKIKEAPLYCSNKPNIKWIKSSYNCGYGRGNNLAFKHSKGSKILIMNPDILISPDNLYALYKVNKSESTISSCKLIYPNSDPQTNFYPQIKHLVKMVNTNIVLEKLKIQLPFMKDEISGFTGALFIFDRNILDADYIFNPIYFMYDEETDFFHKMYRKGIKMNFNDHIIAIHKTEGTVINKEWMKQQKIVSHLQYIRHNYGLIYYLCFIFLKFINILTLLIFLPFIKEKSVQTKEVILFLRSFRYVIKLIFKPSSFLVLCN